MNRMASTRPAHARGFTMVEMLVVLGIGAWFAWLYLSSGSLLKPILIHVLIDLIALALRPAIALRWHARAEAN